MAIELAKDRRDRATAEIRRFFEDELDQDIGDLKAILVLDFFLRELAPFVYNEAVQDAQSWIRDRLDDLEGSVFAVEPSGGPDAGGRPR
jgi:uncharacterized protein (DUF2164 family)